MYSMSSVTWRHWKKPECLCALSLLLWAQSVRVYWITLTSVYTHTHLHTHTPQERRQQRNLSTSTDSSTSACLKGEQRESEWDRQTGAQRGRTSFWKRWESLNRCVNLHERKRDVLTCWATPRLRSVFSVFLIYRWLSEHKWEREMLKNANGTPPSLTPLSREEANRRKRRQEERLKSEGRGVDERWWRLRVSGHPNGKINASKNVFQSRRSGDVLKLNS